MPVKPARTLTVYYRTGGTANFKWQRVGERYDSPEAAQAKVDELRTMGYPAHYERTDRLDAIGLPETFDHGDRVNL